jgi:hypothetical protein
MYFVWESRRNQPENALVPELPVAEGVSLFRGRPIPQEMPEIEIRIDASTGRGLTDDLPVFCDRCLLHSERMREALVKAGAGDSIEYHPVRIVDAETGQVDLSYRAANLLDRIYCIDREASRLTMGEEDPNDIWWIDDLRLRPDRLGDSLLFRLGEVSPVVIAHERVKLAVEEARLTGVVFLPAEGYRDFRGYGLDNPRNVMGTHDEDPDGPLGPSKTTG